MLFVYCLRFNHISFGEALQLLLLLLLYKRPAGSHHNNINLPSIHTRIICARFTAHSIFPPFYIHLSANVSTLESCNRRFLKMLVCVSVTLSRSLPLFLFVYLCFGISYVIWIYRQHTHTKQRDWAFCKHFSSILMNILWLETLAWLRVERARSHFKPG